MTRVKKWKVKNRSTTAYLSLYLIVALWTEFDQPKHRITSNTLQNRYTRFSGPVSVLTWWQLIFVCLAVESMISIAKVFCASDVCDTPNCGGSFYLKTAAVSKILAFTHWLLRTLLSHRILTIFKVIRC